MEVIKSIVRFLRVPSGYFQIAAIVSLCSVAFIYAQPPSQEAVLDKQQLDLALRPADDRPLVRVLEPQIGEHTITITTTGSAVVRNSIDLVPQVSGQILWVSPEFRRGGRFAADQELMRIDREDFELALAQAEADLLSAESDYQLTLANSEAAVANYALLNGDKSVPPLVAKKPQLQQAKARIAAATARVDVARLNLARTSFSLPFAGHVVSSKAEVGQMVSAGQMFGQVFAADAVEVVVPVSPQQLALLEPAVERTAVITMAEQTFSARVARVSPDLDARTRFAQIFLALDESQSPMSALTIHPGAFVDVQIDGPTLADTFMIPEAAEQENGSLWTVVNGELRRVAPKFVSRSDRGILTTQVETGAGVVVGTVPGGFDGLPVNVTPAG
ncbi:MAG: efflux RND transporter periplasmic adaptor subunit [Pseudomonadota bacterium]